jgi:two-component system chemotaxis response regulator CheB
VTAETHTARCLIVVGASAGGVEALGQLVAALPDDLPAAVAVVLHMAASGTSVLPAILDRAATLPTRAATDGEPICAGRVYVAPPNVHLVVEDSTFALRHGPRENGHRPAIDRLFMSAAAEWGRGVVGVVLTGTLDDGAAGLAMIKTRGGCAVVQDPEDALYAGMPANAIARADVDHVVALRDIAPLLAELVAERDRPVSEEDITAGEHAEAPGPELDAGPTMPAGDASGLSCPECGGSLWYVIEQGAPRFRCRIGHAYSEASLLDEHGRSLEIALWTALRALEERAALLRRMAHRAEDSGHPHSARNFGEQARQLDHHAEVVRHHIVPSAMAAGEDSAAVAAVE